MHNKGNYKQDEKTAFRMGENNSKRRNRQRINLKNIQATPAAQFQKNKRPNQKMSQRTKQTLLQRRHTDGQQTHGKMLNITNANQNLNEVPLHTSQMATIQNSTSNICREGVEKREPSYTVVGNAN